MRYGQTSNQCYGQSGSSQGYSQGGNSDLDFDKNMNVTALARYFAGDISNADASNNLRVPEPNARDLSSFDPDGIEQSYREFQDVGGAAAWATMLWFQNWQENQGKQVNRSTLKNALVAYATAKSGGLQSGMFREAVLKQASRDVTALADTKFADDS
ncbi:hypothetical protein BGW42_003019 [Actinomortierella wolfii]|nr:hypothetical protein BGW42_003019 [Actinomortierella wolfii]